MPEPAENPGPTDARAFLSLGSNVGDRAGMLAGARRALAANDRIEIIRASSILENAALLYEDQADFLNQILIIGTTLDPFELLELLQTLEQELGRQKRFRYGPREIDLDILAYENHRIQSETLTLPHPGLGDRDFLRVLLQELDETPESVGRTSA